MYEMKEGRLKQTEVTAALSSGVESLWELRFYWFEI